MSAGEVKMGKNAIELFMELLKRTEAMLQSIFGAIIDNDLDIVEDNVGVSCLGSRSRRGCDVSRGSECK